MIDQPCRTHMRLLLTFALTLGFWGYAIAAEPTIRVATFNASLYRRAAGELQEELRTTNSVQVQRVAEIIQRVNPDILLINEFDYDASGESERLFRRNYLERSQGGQHPVHFKYAFVPPVNTGVDSSLDLDRDGTKGTAGDAWGYGAHPGQYGMLLLSKHPIATADIRTFQHFRWRDMPAAMLPDDPATDRPGDWYNDEVLARFRLSSKTHADVPIRVDQRQLHLLISHPTPPVFDGPEDRNGRRNHDEIRFWNDYITASPMPYIYDDAALARADPLTAPAKGGLPSGASFIIAGDLNCDPFDGDATGRPIDLLLQNPRVNATGTPSSRGGQEAAENNPRGNAGQRGDPRHDTGVFGRIGNLRLDYVLPSADLTVVKSGVYWPAFAGDAQRPEALLVRRASDHRLVWVEVEFRSTCGAD